MQQETFGFQSNAGSGATPLSNITIANTLYVMKNGNDLTALPDRLDKPFLTIFAASQAASVGDTIYVFSGLYNEGTADLFLSNINYVLGAGVTVQTSTPTVNDFSGAKNINISGTGVLYCTNTNGYTVDVTNPNSILNLYCRRVIGDGGGLNLGGTLNINVERLKGNTLLDILMDNVTVSGSISIGTIEGSVKTNSNIIVNKVNVDDVERNLFLNFQKINVFQLLQYALQFVDNRKTKIYLTCELCETVLTSSSDFCFTERTFLFVNNTNFTSSGASNGITTFTQGTVNGNLYLTNSNIKCSGVCLKVNGSLDSIQINNTLLKSDSQAAVLIDDGQLSIYDSVLVGGDGTRASTVVGINNNETNPILRIKNTELF